MEHEKLFKDLLEHGLILESLLNVVDQAEQEMMDTLTKDQSIKGLLEKEMVINNSNQIIFEPTSNISRGSQIIYHLSEEWKQVFNKYLKNRRNRKRKQKQKQSILFCLLVLSLYCCYTKTILTKRFSKTIV